MMRKKLAKFLGADMKEVLIDPERVIDKDFSGHRLHLILRDGNPIPIRSRCRTEVSKILYNAEVK